MRKLHLLYFRLMALLSAGLFSLPIFAQKNITALGHLQYETGVKTSNLTGYVDSAGREYALVGTTEGASVVRIDTPSNPKQVFLIPGATGPNGSWRELRTYKGFAYITTEQSSGLVVADLRELPDTVLYHTVRPGNMRTSHTIFIDENGIAYVNGTDVGQLFLDLNADAWDPPLLGRFTNNYVHDCFVRKDTMWAACVNDGIVKVIDVTDKTNTNNPSRTITAFATPQNFTHNCWLSDDSKYLFTTDEMPNSVVACYDVSNLNNVTETDRARTAPGIDAIMHNVYFINNYIVASYYTTGIAIYDVLRKTNIVEVGHFDTSPLAGNSFSGAWGVWPYLPSGNIIVSDVENGLWILKPTYKRAAYLEGNVKAAGCNTAQNDVTVEILGDSTVDYTNLTGNYNMGTPDTGTFTVRFSKNGYETKDSAGVVFRNGQFKRINVELVPVSTTQLVVKTIDSATTDSLPFTRVLVQDTFGITEQEIATNNRGQYSVCDFVQGSYDFYAGRWGRETVKVQYDDTVSVDTLILPTARGYYDDFIMDYGWTVVTNASTGAWVRGIPLETVFEDSISNPGADVPGDYGKACYVTGNTGGLAGNDDVDDGYTLLRSPFFNIQNWEDPHITYYRWFFNAGGDSPPNDTLIVTLINGSDTAMVDSVFTSASQWVYKDIRVKDFMTPGLNSRIEFKVQDYSPGHIVEAGIDFFRVYNVDTIVRDTTIIIDTTDTTVIDTTVFINPVRPDNSTTMKVYPNPSVKAFFVSVKNGPVNGSWLELCNTLGQVIYRQHITSKEAIIEIDENPPPGVYFLRLMEGRRIVSQQKVVRTG